MLNSTEQETYHAHKSRPVCEILLIMVKVTRDGSVEPAHPSPPVHRYAHFKNPKPADQDLHCFPCILLSQ